MTPNHGEPEGGGYRGGNPPEAETHGGGCLGLEGKRSIVQLQLAQRIPQYLVKIGE